MLDPLVRSSTPLAPWWICLCTRTFNRSDKSSRSKVARVAVFEAYPFISDFIGVVGSLFIAAFCPSIWDRRNWRTFLVDLCGNDQ